MCLSVCVPINVYMCTHILYEQFHKIMYILAITIINICIFVFHRQFI